MGSDRIARRVEQLLMDARAAREADDWDELRALAAAVVALDPGNAEARTILDGSARRVQMTLMFCDVVESTALADTRDPEEMTEILRQYRATCTEVIERYGGFIEDRRGDGLLVRFGYPWVHEDDARRAVTSALEIVRATRERGPVLGVDLHLRIAVHTGLVVVDQGEVVGSAPNVAARLQATATPDAVVMSGATHELVRGHFDVEPLGPRQLKGVSAEVEAFTVLRECADAQLEAATSLTPFTGRQAELELIESLWRSVLEGGEEALLLSGGPGTGKSRLLAEAVQRAGARQLVCRCSSYHQTRSLYPFRGALAAVCGITEGDGAHDRLAKLRARLASTGVDDDLPLLADALSIPGEALSPPLDVDPAKLRAIALEVAAGLVRGHAREAPTILLVEDVHWADESTVDLLSLLLMPGRPGLLPLLATRPAPTSPWPTGLVQRIDLGPMPRPELVEMARSMRRGLPFGAEHDRALIDRCDGVPLFLEELVRTAGTLEHASGLQPLGARAAPDVPAALRDPLLSRLALPGVDLDLAQLAATIGRDVDREVLRRASGLDEKRFGTKLANLIAAGILDPAGAEAIRFRHALIRDVAYGTQRHNVRRERHSRIADELRVGAVATAGDAGEIAFHLESAGRYEEAVDAHVAAASDEQALGAHKEATAKLTHVLDLIDRLPESVERLTRELAVRHMRSFSAIMAGGYSTPESIEDHARSLALCGQLGSGSELLPSLILGWAYYCSQGDLRQADQVCDMLEVATADLDAPLYELGKGVVNFFRGDFEQAVDQMSAAIEHPWATPPGRLPAEWPMPNDPFVAVAAHLLVTHWILGRPEEALALAERALPRAAQLPFPFGPFSNGYLQGCLVLMHRLDGDHARAQLHVRQMSMLAERHGFALWSLVSQIQEPVSRVHMGDAAAVDAAVAGVRMWREGLASEVWSPYFLTEVAVAQSHAGQPAAAIATLDEALAVAARTGSEFFDAEILRIRGRLRCEGGDPRGRDDLERAVEKARRQHATAFERRAAAELEAAGALLS